MKRKRDEESKKHHLFKGKVHPDPSPGIARPPAAALAAGFEADLKHAAGDGADGSWRFRLGWSPPGVASAAGQEAVVV